jgi:hypothetical protein
MPGIVRAPPQTAQIGSGRPRGASGNQNRTCASSRPVTSQNRLFAKADDSECAKVADIFFPPPSIFVYKVRFRSQVPARAGESRCGRRLPYPGSETPVPATKDRPKRGRRRKTTSRDRAGRPCKGRLRKVGGSRRGCQHPCGRSPPIRVFSSPAPITGDEKTDWPLSGPVASPAGPGLDTPAWASAVRAVSLVGRPLPSWARGRSGVLQEGYTRCSPRLWP